MAIGRKTGGRKLGTPNKATAEIRDAAQRYTAEALGVLRDIMRTGASEQARVAAANSILDRGWGKPTQILDAAHRIERDPAELSDAELRAIISDHIVSAKCSGGKDAAASEAVSETIESALKSKAPTGAGAQNSAAALDPNFGRNEGWGGALAKTLAGASGQAEQTAFANACMQAKGYHQ
jgi:hypothetical protein